jgi:hypothetical protein
MIQHNNICTSKKFKHRLAGPVYGTTRPNAKINLKALPMRSPDITKRIQKGKSVCKICFCCKIWNATGPFGTPHITADCCHYKTVLQRESNQIPKGMRIPQDDVYPCVVVWLKYWQWVVTVKIREMHFPRSVDGRSTQDQSIRTDTWKYWWIALSKWTN